MFYLLGADAEVVRVYYTLLSLLMDLLLTLL